MPGTGSLFSSAWRRAHHGGVVGSAPANMVTPILSTARVKSSFIATNTASALPASTADYPDLLIVQGPWRTDMMTPYKSGKPKGKIFCYQDMSQTGDPSGGNNGCLVDKSVCTTNGWMMHKPDGVTLAVNNSFGNRWTVNPTVDYGASAAAAALSKMDAATAALGFRPDGIFLDDFNWHQWGYNDSPTGFFEYPSEDAAFVALRDNALRQIYDVLHRFGYQVIVNANGTEGQYATPMNTAIPYIDGMFSEYTVIWPGAGWVSSSYVFDAFNSADLCIAAGKMYIGSNAPGSTATAAQQRSAWAAGAMFQSAGSYANVQASYSAFVNFTDPFAKYLGLPTGARTEVATGVFRRAFAGGIVYLNTTASAFASANGSVPAHDALITVPNTAAGTRSGDTVYIDHGVWNNLPTGFARQFRRNGVAISGQNGLTYTLTDSDVGQSISAAVTASNAIGPNSADSNAITPVAGPAGGTAPAFTSDPVVSPPTVTVGDTITCSTGSTSGSTPITTTYQWQRNGINISSGATSVTYLTTSADQGQSIRCHVTATNSFGFDTADSNAVSPAAVASGTLFFQDSFDHDADGLVVNFKPPWDGLTRAFADRAQTLTEAEVGFAPVVGTHSMMLRTADLDKSASSGGVWSGNSSIGAMPGTNNARCQFEPVQGLSYNQSGQVTYYHFAIRIPASCPNVPTSQFAVCAQFHGAPWSQSPNFALNFTSFDTPTNTFSFGNAVTNPNQKVWQDSGPVVRDTWYKFTLLIRWATSGGYFELWKNGVHQILNATRAGTLSNSNFRWNGPTLKGDQSNGIQFYGAQNYRSGGASLGFVTYYFDAVKAGSTYAIVQP